MAGGIRGPLGPRPSTEGLGLDVIPTHASARGGMVCMTFRDGWICKACWKSNRPQDPYCLRCRTPRDADEAAVEAARAAKEAAAARPEAVPDIVVALPVVI